MRTLLNTTITTLCAVAAFSTTASADLSWISKKGFGAGGASSQHMPPAGYASQWWVHPSGCECSRAGLPGEAVWYVIINTIGNRNCQGMIVQKAHSSSNY